MTLIISVAQIIVSVLVIALILIQDRSADMGGGIFGGSESGGFYQARRGFEKIIFITTVILVVLFGILALAHFLV